jgi:vacuolar protein 8
MIDGDFDEDEGLRLMPIPDCFICPLTATVMEDPVMTVDGCTYERTYIERWFRQRQQERLRVTSPATNQELPSLRLVSLTALRVAIEAYLGARPELRDAHLASRSFEEAAQMLYGDLLEKQAVHANAEDELSLLKDSNEVLLRTIQDTERVNTSLRYELEQSRMQAQTFGEALREERATNESLASRLQLLESSLSRQEGTDELGRQGLQCLTLSSCHKTQAGDRSVDARPDAVTQKPCLLQTTCCKDESRHIAINFWSLLMCAVMLLCVLFVRDLRHRDVSAEVGTPLVVRNVSFHSEALKLDSMVEPSMGEVRSTDDGIVLEVDDSFGIANQVKYLRTGTHEEKTHAALLLGLAAAASPENQAAIVEAGAIPPLVELLHTEGPEARGQAAVALRTLAMGNAYNKVAMEKAGAIPLLARLLKDESLEVQEVAAGALQVLAEAKSQEEGAMDSLAALLKEDERGVREEAEGALMLLALDAVDQAALDTIPSLMEMLRHEAPEVALPASATAGW